MKNNKALKMLAFSLAAVLILMHLFTLAPLAVNGAETEWSFSENKQYLTNETDSKTYKHFFNGVAIRPDSQTIFVYNQSMEYDDFIYSSVYANPDNPGAVWVDYYDSYEIFVTDEFEADLIAFTEGKSGNYFLENGSGARSEFSQKILSELDHDLAKGVGVETFSVSSLRLYGNALQVYNIIVQDESKTFAYTYGAIYKIGNSLWYLNYTNLDNCYFDADGNFSYRSGNIELARVNNTNAAEIYKYMANAVPYDVYYDYEKVIFDGMGGEIVDDFLGDDPEVALSDIIVGFFWVVYFAIIVLPAIAILTVSCILPFSRKLGKPKYWFVVAGFAAVWLIAAIAHAVLLMSLPLS